MRAMSANPDAGPETVAMAATIAMEPTVRDEVEPG
jgi:hypothetical protein